MDNLKRLRKSKGITQTEFAKLLNVTQATYSEYESGKCKPSFETLNKICDILNCSSDYLLGRTPDAFFDTAALPKSEIQEIYDALDAPRQQMLTGYAHALLDDKNRLRAKKIT